MTFTEWHRRSKLAAARINDRENDPGLIAFTVRLSEPPAVPWWRWKQRRLRAAAWAERAVVLTHDSFRESVDDDASEPT